jgi:hypothetical protein
MEAIIQSAMRRLCAETCRSLDEMNGRSGRWRSFAGVMVTALVDNLWVGRVDHGMICPEAAPDEVRK